MSTSVLIYTTFVSPRLHYTIQWVAARLGTTFALTTDKAAWLAFDGSKINYSATPLADSELRIIPHVLLSETGIRKQEPAVQRWKHNTILFYNQPGAVIPFDLFAAVFYLISRYEEYLPYTPDKHGRYPADQSLATQYAFLQQPVVDEWIYHFGRILGRQFGLGPKENTFRLQPTYDVDIAWKYRHKGSMRHWGGLAKDLLQLNWKSVVRRSAVVAGKKEDPYYCFAWLDTLHRQYQLKPLYFMLLGQPGAFDKNADPDLPAMQQLMRSLAGQYTVGIHPSYASHQGGAMLQREINSLQQATGTPVSRSRQHYIKFSLPHTYRGLIDAGITHDYSMGYASANGFRAGTSHAFPWYDLEAEAVTKLTIHPFVYMDATSKFYNKYSIEEAWQEWERLYHAVKKVNGTFISIAHNHLLGPAPENKGWAALYERMLAYTQE